MVAGKQRHTFISYSRINKAFALKLARELKAAGFPVWLDQLDIPTGARWDDEIEKALRECGIFMTILTPAFIASENAKDEMGYAIDHGKRILPVLLEECEVPLRLRRFQYVDFTSMNYDQGVAAAKDLLSRLIKEESIPIAKKAPSSKEQPTQPAINVSAYSKPGTSPKKAMPAEDVRDTRAAVAGKRWPIYAGVAVVVLLVLIGGAGFLGGVFSPASATSTPAPTQAGTPTSAPTLTAVADSPTSEPQGFYVEEFDANPDDWEFFRRSGKEDTEFRYAANGGKLVVHVAPNGDEPQGYLINKTFSYSDVRLEVVTINKGNNSNGVSLVCRHSDQGWYEFWISNDQSYGIYAFGPNGEVLQAGYQLASADSPLIRDGYAENTYTGICKGDELTLEINGERIATVKAKYGFTEGSIGIGFSAFQNRPADLEIESLEISQP